MNVDGLLLESCRADAIEEMMNDRFEEEYEICEGVAVMCPQEKCTATNGLAACARSAGR